MTLKFSDRPVLHYGRQPSPDSDWRERFSQNAQPTATAPERGGRLVWVFEPSSAGYLAVHYRGNWQMLREARDNRTGTTRLEMTGEAICNPVAWASS